jgi:radical SAM superfamily enzyme YgiQ (UPF0313 family)
MRVGLIALSGVRACDEELMRLGLTLPGFVERSKVIASLPSLGLLTLAGMTPHQHDCVYFEVEDVRAMGDLPEGLDLVAISSLSAQIGEAYELADRFRERRVPVVMGGLHVTAVPQEAGRHADAVVIGEGESCWEQMLDDADRGRLQQVYRSEGGFDLGQTRMPAYELLDINRYNRLTVQTSRGCPFRCEFCAPVQNVLDEINHIRSVWRRPFIEFADDNALVNKRYWKELLTELKQLRLRWFAETDLSVYEDEELLSLMRDSGCAQVLIGFESPVETGLDGLELKANWKAKSWPQSLEAVRRIQSHGVRVTGCFVLGLDGHTPEVFDAVYEFTRRAELFDVQITLMTPFPGTPLHERLQRDGRLLDPTAWETCTLFDVNYRPQPMTVDELREGFRQLAVRLYSDEETRWRKENFNRKFLSRAQRAREAAS